MKTRWIGLTGLVLIVFCGCSSLDFDTFKDKPKEKTSSRSKYSILAEPGDGAKVIDPGSLEEDMIKVSEVKSHCLQPVRHLLCVLKEEMLLSLNKSAFPDFILRKEKLL